MASREAHRIAARRRDASGKKHHHKKRRSQGQSGLKSESTPDEDRRERRSRQLSAAALAQLDDQNARSTARRHRELRPGRRRVSREAQQRLVEKSRNDRSKKKRVVSGAILEEGRALRGGGGNTDDSIDKEDLYRRSRPKKSRKKLWIYVGCGVVVLIIIIVVVAVIVSKKNSGSSGPNNSGLNGMNHDEIPAQWQGTYLDPWTWYDTTDFNLTFTDVMVGDLPIMGLMSSWDDSQAANQYVPALDQPWGSYGSKPARGVNLGGWLSLEPFITPSLFNYDSSLGIVDEYTLSTYLGNGTGSVIEKHYATFVTESTFADIAAAGLDHVRIPYSYWAVEVYDGDPYLFRTSWRYLLRGIEWARKYGLRINLDLHGLPGSQNGWNHSGRLGPIGWLNGTDGQVNANRSLDVHDRLTQFFAQPRYQNIIAFYGLANEPRMTFLPTDEVLSWTTDAYNLVRTNGVNAIVVFGDGFMGLNNWKGLLTGISDLVLDVHQYVIFNTNQIVFTHQAKVQYACQGWTEQAQDSMNTATGYGPTMFAEWSQADTDCAEYLTNVGWGNRWEGTYNSGNASTNALTPRCPTTNSQCSCTQANADVSQYSSEYKQFLLMFAEAQMQSFENGWGWWYWTWDTESAPLWSYKQALAAGIMPTKAYQRDFDCSQTVPDFASSGLPETY